MRILFILTSISIGFSLFGQRTIIKGTIRFLPPPVEETILLGLVSIGIEHPLNKKISADLIGSYIMPYPNEGSGVEYIWSVNSSLRYYFLKKNQLIRIWSGPNLVFARRYYSGEINTNRGNYLGAGINFGIRLFLSTNLKWMLDMGAGMAFGLFKYTYYRKEIMDTEGYFHSEYTIPDPELRWLPRGILQIGYVIGKINAD